MTDPPRLRDLPDVDRDVLALLAHAERTPQLDPNAAAVIGARVEALGSGGAARTWWPRPPVLLAVAVAGAVLIAMAVVLWRSRPLPRLAPVPSPPPPASSAALAPETAEPTEAITQAGDAGAPSVAMPASAASRTPSPAPEDTLRVEARFLERARGDVDARPDRALQELEAHARRFPHGQLAVEREYLALIALSRLGRTDEARERGARFLREHSDSPYVPLVKRALTERR